jgi:S-adenosylmethionine:tRNA ribosyltransferase-isomerase
MMAGKNIFDISNYDYKVPQELIAQAPIEKRDESRLLVLDRKTGAIEHDRFFNLANYIDAGDCVVVNNTKVIPAALYGRKQSGSARLSLLLLDHLGGRRWSVLMKNSRRVAAGSVVIFADNVELRVIEKNGKRVEVEFNLDHDGLLSALRDIGVMPLPQYIREDIMGKKHMTRYQTIYAAVEGAKAAPTAGLHFTKEVFGSLRQKGASTAEVTLHVGLGTFEAVEERDIRKHVMHEEYFSVTQSAADKINAARDSGGRVIACGTTSLRTLESSFTGGCVRAGGGRTSIYIYPGYEFKAVSALITNFHLPKTTLLALVYAFGGVSRVKNAYSEAIKQKYRFYSYGDAMLII